MTIDYPRHERLSGENPLIIADTAHNEAGIKEIVSQINNTTHKQLHFILGVVNDKDITEMLQLLPQNAIYYFTNAAIPRALKADELATQAAAYNLKGSIYNSVADALSAAKQTADKEDLIFIGGSTFTVAEVV